jgi:hypothetical protein
MRSSWHRVTQVVFAIACGTGACSNDGTEEDPPVTYKCPQGFLTQFSWGSDWNVRERYTGHNGEFTDTCQNDILIQYECEVMTVDARPTDGSYSSATGNVVSTNVDCRERMFDGAPGRCVRGACQAE